MTRRAGQAGPGGDREGQSPSHGHLQCPFCNSYDVSRLYVASFEVESCECLGCGARWDEDARSGEYLGRHRHPSASVRARRR